MREGPLNGHWVTRVYVVRGDAIAEYREDHGPIEDWPNATETVYPSFGENSVGELMFLAERDRHDNQWFNWREELKAESTLIPDILRQNEVNHEWIKNRSVIGPGITVQRNEYDSNIVKRKLRDKRKTYSGIIPQGGN